MGHSQGPADPTGISNLQAQPKDNFQRWGMRCKPGQVGGSDRGRLYMARPAGPGTRGPRTANVLASHQITPPLGCCHEPLWDGKR